MTAHTPGPWTVGPHPGNGAGDDWRTVLATSPEFGPLYIAEAIAPDARLIAAAPTMLAALMLAAQNATDRTAERAIRAAIAAATGEG